MRRRDFIALSGIVAVAGPVAVQAQQAAKPVAGFLHPQAEYWRLSGLCPGVFCTTALDPSETLAHIERLQS